MMRDALFIVQKDLHYLLRRRETLLWTFVMPIIFFYFIGTVTGGFGGRSGEAEPISVIVPANAGFVADELITRLEQRNFHVVNTPGFFREIDIPENFTATVLAGKPVKIEFARHGEGLEYGLRSDPCRPRRVYGAGGFDSDLVERYSTLKRGV